MIFIYDRVTPTTVPRKLTAEGGKSVTDTVTLKPGARFGFSAHGPNGFVRQWGGIAPLAPSPSPAVPSNATSCHGYTCTVELQLCPEGASTLHMSLYLLVIAD